MNMKKPGGTTVILTNGDKTLRPETGQVCATCNGTGVALVVPIAPYTAVGYGICPDCAGNRLGVVEKDGGKINHQESTGNNMFLTGKCSVGPGNSGLGAFGLGAYAGHAEPGAMPIRGDEKKHDHGKPMWDLLPYTEVEQIVRVLTHGAEKYAPDQWKTVDDGNNRYFAAMLRHLVAWRSGERTDVDSGLPHLAHAGCCLLFLMWMDSNTPEDGC